MTISGRCLCGTITYTLDNKPAVTGVCHCKNCQRQAGSAFSTLAGIPAAQLHIEGSPKCYQDADTVSGNTVDRYFCGDCGSPIYSQIAAQPDMAYVKTGTLDDTNDFTPMFHCWCSTKQMWVTLSDGAPAFETNPG